MVEQKQIYLILSIILLTIIISGCSVNYDRQIPKENTKTNDLEKDCFPFCDDGKTETIKINGVNQNQEISNDEPIKLEINGVGNIIKISRGTEVIEIKINGKDITVSIPHTIKPKITNNGINNQILYY